MNICVNDENKVCPFCHGPLSIPTNNNGSRASFYIACKGTCNRTWNLRDGKLNPSPLKGTTGPTPRGRVFQHFILNVGMTRSEVELLLKQRGVMALLNQIPQSV
jgi:hypothetical protein